MHPHRWGKAPDLRAIDPDPRTGEGSEPLDGGRSRNPGLTPARAGWRKDVSLVIVGGHSRNIGKTSVAAGLIAALREFPWTAVKITQYGQGICSQYGEQCACADDEHPYSIREESEGHSGNDSSRFLAAGARRSFWVRTKQGQLERALPDLKNLIEHSDHVIVESNSILRYVRPDLYLVVLSFGVEDFKASAREFLPRADGVVLVDSLGRPKWTGIDERAIRHLPAFPVLPPAYVSESLAGFVRSRLAAPTRDHRLSPDPPS